MRTTTGRRAPFAGIVLAVALLASLVGSSPAGSGPTTPVDPGVGAPSANAVNEVTGDIERAYKTILGRLPDPQGLRFWLAQYAAGMDLAAIYGHFLASPERQDRYPAGQDDTAFLTQLYLDAFGRAPDAGGLEFWQTQLAGGTSRTRVIEFFADSLEQREAVAADTAFSLEILHINDHHSHLEGDDTDLMFGVAEVEVDFGGFSRVVALMDQLATDDPTSNVVKIHAGDAITGTLYYSLFDGEADAAMMNEVCFDVFAPGNHEFDGGDEGLATFLDFLDADPDCDTDVVAANIVPAVGTPLLPTAETGYLEPYTIIDYDGDQVGYVGIDIASKTKRSSSPLETTQFLDEVATAQSAIDELTAMGIDKIVLVTHYQYANDIELASMVDGVDVIVGGDSHTLLGDFDQYGLATGGEYPTRVTDKSGRPVCIVQAWQYAAVVGELHVDFDRFGHVASCEGTPHLMLGADGIDGVMAIVDADPQLTVVAPDPDAEAVLAAFEGDVAALAAVPIATVTDDLCLERIPGQGRSAIAGCTALTAENGGDIQQLVATAFREMSFEADIALQNAGGVRIDIPAGPMSIADAYELLPFANTLVNLEMTGAQIKASLEEGIENAVMPDGSTGAYPYAAGLRFDVDLNQPAGSRVSNLEYQAKGTDTWVAFDLAATYTVVSNSFQASGGDGYDTMGEIYDSGAFVDTFLDYAKSFIDYVETLPVDGGTGLPALSKLPVEDYSTQSFTPLPG